MITIPSLSLLSLSREIWFQFAPGTYFIFYIFIFYFSKKTTKENRRSYYLSPSFLGFLNAFDYMEFVALAFALIFGVFGFLFLKSRLKKAMAAVAEQRQTGASMMEQLVPEITTHALSYLDYPSLCRLSMTNSRMREAANDDNAWKALYHKVFFYNFPLYIVLCSQ